ncbi:MAG TPA: hypothetical protein VG347_23270 [Verrucomicrobiae bacterium]|nr:hypothetical protein [Verrucomicrobiae bacterium]
MNFPGKLKAGCANFSLDCREAARVQSEALDHPLPISKRIGLWLHLFICKWCRRYGQQIRFLRKTAQKYPDALGESAAQQLSPAARNRIKQKLKSVK